MAEHHPLFSPSASSRWLTCTASPMPISHGYEGTVNKYAAEGSLAHLVLEDFLRHGGRCTPRFDIGAEHVIDDHELEVTREMHNAVEWCLDIIFGVGAGVTLSETRVKFPVEWSEGTEFVEGTADCIANPAEDSRTLHVFDLKYGRGVPVYAKRNTQMMCYGLGSLHSLDYLLEDINRVVIHVLQPRLDHHDMWATNPAELWEWAETDVRTAVDEVLTGVGQFRPSEEACRWCPIGRSGECKVQVDHVLSDFEVVTASEEPANAVAFLEPAQLGDLLPHLSWLEKVIEQLRSRALRLILAKEPLPGWKCVEGRSNRQWSDDALKLLESIEGLDPYEPQELKSPAAIEKELGKKRWRESPLPDAVFKPKGKPTLAPESDKRPVFDPEANVEDDFDVLD